MDSEKVYDVLLDNSNIAAVIELSTRQYCDIIYECLYSCELIVENEQVPVYIGVPNNWKQELFDIYIENNNDFPYIPHIDTRGKLCLFDLEGVLIDDNFAGLLNQCIERAILIISDGLNKKNQSDFIKEFDAYWSKLQNYRIIKCVLPNINMTQKIKYVDSTDKRRGNEFYTRYKRGKNSTIFAASDTDSFSTWEISGTQKNGIYFYIESKEYIYPPDPREHIKIKYFNDLLRQCDVNAYTKLKTKIGKDKMFIFKIKQPNGDNTCIGVLLKNATIEFIDETYQIKETCELEAYPLLVKRIDKKYLMSRISDTTFPNEKKILLIGCGSIGGYLANELIRTGFEDITLVDNDIMSEENIFRHFLGAEYVGMYKADALVKYFKKNIPNLKLNPMDGDIQTLIVEQDIKLIDYDIIISATGNHNINRFLNKEIYGRGINIPVIYVWNEPLDIGCHAAVIQFKYRGCYECFFDRTDVTGELFDATAYCKKNQKIIRNFAGCGNSFIPYGSTVSLKSTALCIDLISKVMENRCYCNILASLKGDGYYFKKVGFIVSEVYEKQKEGLDISDVGKKFKKGCEVCRQICNYKM